MASIVSNSSTNGPLLREIRTLLRQQEDSNDVQYITLEQMLEAIRQITER